MGVSTWSAPADGKSGACKNLKAGTVSKVDLSHALCIFFGIILVCIWSSVGKEKLLECPPKALSSIAWEAPEEELPAGPSREVSLNKSRDQAAGSSNEGFFLQNWRQGSERGLKQLLAREYPKAKLHNIVFGIAGTVATWGERQEYVRSWWIPGEMRGFVFMDNPEAENQECTSDGSQDGQDSSAVGGDSGQQDAEGAEKEDEEELHVKCKHTQTNRSKADTSFMSQKDPSLPELRYSADFSRYKYTNPVGTRSAIRVARVVVEAFRILRDDVHWYVMGDDDTIFSPDNLVAMLNKYDPRGMHYIGAPSESHPQNIVFSNYMAYGGAGFAISHPLAELLNRMYDDCLNRYPELYGSDARVQACVSELGVQMTLERGFHQMDFHGSITGLLEAHPLAPFISMHHLSGLDPLLPSKSRMESIQEVTKVMTKHPLEFLQQSMCMNQEHDWSVNIAWGYSVRWYPQFLRPYELERAQQTFRGWNSGKDPGFWGDSDEFDLDVRYTRVRDCTAPSLFTIAEAGWKIDSFGNRTLLQTEYTRTPRSTRSLQKKRRQKGGKKKGEGKGRNLLTAGDALVERADGREGRRKLLGLCPQGLKRVPPSTVETVRVLQPPLEETWVFKPRRQCCRSLELLEDATVVEIHLGPCGLDKTMLI